MKKGNSKYKSGYCEALIDYCSRGFTWSTFAAEIQVSKSTVYDWLKKHKEFAEAKEIAEVKCEQFWEKKGLKPKSRDFHFGVYKLVMTNRFGYKEKPKPEEHEKAVIILPAVEDDDADKQP